MISPLQSSAFSSLLAFSFVYLTSFLSLFHRILMLYCFDSLLFYLWCFSLNSFVEFLTWRLKTDLSCFSSFYDFHFLPTYNWWGNMYFKSHSLIETPIEYINKNFDKCQVRQISRKCKGTHNFLSFRNLIHSKAHNTSWFTIQSRVSFPNSKSVFKKQ